MAKKRGKLHGSVKKLVKPVLPHETEKAEIEIHEADDFYKEIRVENVVTDETGKEEHLKPGEDIDVILEADPGEDKQKS